MGAEFDGDYLQWVIDYWMVDGEISDYTPLLDPSGKIWWDDGERRSDIGSRIAREIDRYFLPEPDRAKVSLEVRKKLYWLISEWIDKNNSHLVFREARHPSKARQSYRRSIEKRVTPRPIPGKILSGDELGYRSEIEQLKRSPDKTGLRREMFKVLRDKERVDGFFHWHFDRIFF